MSTVNQITRWRPSNIYGTALLAVFVSLVMKSALDVFFKDTAQAADLGAILKESRTHASLTVLRWLQLLALVATLVHFYIGTEWFFQHQREGESDANGHAAKEVLIEIGGMILIFAAMYIASLFVRNPTLFYLAFLATPAAGAVTTLLMKRYIQLDKKEVGVTNIFLAFDLIAILILLFATLAPVSWRFYPQYAAAGGMLLLGLAEFQFLWPYYQKRSA